MFLYSYSIEMSQVTDSFLILVYKFLLNMVFYEVSTQKFYKNYVIFQLV